MIVVSDTTPLNYLILTGMAHVLPSLFEEVLVPPTVLAELSHPRAPESVRTWVAAPPLWVRVASPKHRIASAGELDAGEADAISLAKERGIIDVLMDEYRGRKIAAQEGLIALPTLAILELAASNGLIQLQPAVDLLRQTTYRIRPELLAAALERDRKRREP